MKPSDWKAPEPATVSSAILFHCATVFPGGSTAAALPVPTDATTSTKTAIATTRRTRVRTHVLTTSVASMSAAGGCLDTPAVLFRFMASLPRLLVALIPEPGPGHPASPSSIGAPCGHTTQGQPSLRLWQ